MHRLLPSLLDGFLGEACCSTTSSFPIVSVSERLLQENCFCFRDTYRSTCGFYILYDENPPQDPEVCRILGRTRCLHERVIRPGAHYPPDTIF